MAATTERSGYLANSRLPQATPTTGVTVNLRKNEKPEPAGYTQGQRLEG